MEKKSSILVVYHIQRLNRLLYSPAPQLVQPVAARRYRRDTLQCSAQIELHCHNKGDDDEVIANESLLEQSRCIDTHACGDCAVG
jgi:hypothetical protein